MVRGVRDGQKVSVVLLWLQVTAGGREATRARTLGHIDIEPAKGEASLGVHSLSL